MVLGMIQGSIKRCRPRPCLLFVLIAGIGPALLLLFGVCFELEIVFRSLFMFWLFYFIIFIVLTQIFMVYL